MDYRPRIVDLELDELIVGLPAIALEGPKAVGKTETARRRAATIHRLDDPGQRQIALANPDQLTTGEYSILIDEWQRLPSSWDLVRRAVDRNHTSGQFLVTGSATPTAAQTHSGAGRIVTTRMRPMLLAGRHRGVPTVSLATLLSGQRPSLEGATRFTVADDAAEIVRSGFSAIRELTGRPLRTQLDGYIERIVERDFEKLGHKIRNEGALLGALFESLVTLSVRMYAQANEARVSHPRTRDGEPETVNTRSTSSLNAQTGELLPSKSS